MGLELYFLKAMLNLGSYTLVPFNPENVGYRKHFGRMATLAQGTSFMSFVLIVLTDHKNLEYIKHAKHLNLHQAR